MIYHDMTSFSELLLTRETKQIMYISIHITLTPVNLI